MQPRNWVDLFKLFTTFNYMNKKKGNIQKVEENKVNNKKHIDIVKTALEIEKMALHYYRKLAKIAETAELEEFWRYMSVEEAGHLTFWRELLNSPEKIEPIFNRPEKIAEELSAVLDNITQVQTDNIENESMGSKFLTAFKMEFFMLHPAFEAMFMLMGTWVKRISSYERHIEELIKKSVQFGSSTPETELLSQLMFQLIKSNRLAAERLSDIHALRGLLPICMHCKKIYESQDTWTGLETYIEQHSHAQFTHGLCPVCAVKYYGEYFDDES